MIVPPQSALPASPSPHPTSKYRTVYTNSRAVVFRKPVAGPQRPILTTAMPEMQQRGRARSSATSAAAATRYLEEPQREQEVDPHVPVSIPPWVHNHDSTSVDDANFLRAPQNTRPNTRHYKPPPTHYKPGRKWDHMRSPSPPIISSPIADNQARWRPFMYSGPTSQEQEEQSRVVGQAWLDEHMPALGEGWKEEDDMRVDGEQMQVWSGKGLMYGGRWLISPERQERSVRFFWVSLLSCQSVHDLRTCSFELFAFESFFGVWICSRPPMVPWHTVTLVYSLEG